VREQVAALGVAQPVPAARVASSYIWRITDPRQLRIWAGVYVVGAVGWLVNALAKPTVLEWAVAIVWLLIAGVFLIGLLRIRARS
jgi:uncharacterized membrane protein YfcA